MRPALLFLVLALVNVGCSNATEAPDAHDLDAGSPADTSAAPDAPLGDGGPTRCTQDCHALEDACHVAHCNEAAGLCVIENRDGLCDDGDPCTNTDQCLVGACVGFHIPGCCIPDCAGASCGDDGCGGSCGTCGAGMLCDGSRHCAASSLAGDTCTTPTEIAALPFHATSTTATLTNDYGLPWGSCAADGFGQDAPDAVFRYHPLHDGVIMVSLSASAFTGGLYATTDCADLRYACVGALAPFAVPTLGPTPIDVRAGVDVFLVVDGDGTTGGAFTLDVTTCSPDCSGAQCGADGCLQLCEHQCPRNIEWNCSTARTCVCEPSCTDRACGSDGCTGSCGTCGGGNTCDPHGHCVHAGLPGDTAATAVPITTPTFSYSGDTTGYGDDASVWGACRANVGEEIFHGDGTPDVLFSLAPAVPTTYYVAVTATGFDVALYSLADAADPYSCIEGDYEPATLRNQLLLEASAIDPANIVVDADATGSGPFTITAHACHTAADCPDASAGQFCSWPIVVPALPFDTTDFRGTLNAYETPAGACGSAHALGVDGDDSVYALTAPRSGSITARVTGLGQMDPILVVATDCAQLATSCVAAVDATGENGTETVTFSAIAGTTYYVIVDSFGPLGGQLHLTIDEP